MNVNEHEYERMRAWFARIVTLVLRDVTPETDPVKHLDDTRSVSRARARQGLSMAIGDIVAMTVHWPLEQVQRLDQAFEIDELPTLSAMRLRFLRVVRLVIRRGRISTDNGYYAIREAAESDNVSREALLPLLEAFEQRYS